VVYEANMRPAGNSLWFGSVLCFLSTALTLPICSRKDIPNLLRLSPHVLSTALEQVMEENWGGEGQLAHSHLVTSHGNACGVAILQT